MTSYLDIIEKPQGKKRLQMNLKVAADANTLVAIKKKHDLVSLLMKRQQSMTTH